MSELIPSMKLKAASCDGMSAYCPQRPHCEGVGDLHLRDYKLLHDEAADNRRERNIAGGVIEVFHYLPLVPHEPCGVRPWTEDQTPNSKQ